MKNIKKSFYFNIFIVIFEIVSLLWMMSGVKIFAINDNLTAARFAMFKYFTVDSNFIMGIISFVTAYEEYKIINGKKSEISNIIYILKLLATVSITLTMIVTIFYLAPTMGLGVVLVDSNLFLHVINPILSIITFILYEKTLNISFIHTFTACIPLIIYAIYYVLLSIMNIENGKILPGYDWYGFFFLGIKSILIVFPIIILLTYLISVLLWKLNKKGV